MAAQVKQKPEEVRPEVIAKRVLNLEVEALQALSQNLDGAFTRAVEMLDAVNGRVVVSGMGKSGHVAGKIAATLASTGTPAQFVHPAEASHGDLGMFAGGDALIALSNSGNTSELSDIVHYSKRFGIPLIGITSKSKSVLAEASDVALILPPVGEACPMGLAPTSSTTMMMALGDAIAVALLERRGFSAHDFKALHPGGTLGRKLLRVSDIMHSGEELPLCTPETPMAEAILTMTAKTFGCVGVVDPQKKLIGVVTDGDLRRHMEQNLLTLNVGDVMTSDPKRIRPHALAAEALHMMNASDHPFTSLFVAEEDDRVIGILSMHDCLRAGIA